MPRKPASSSAAAANGTSPRPASTRSARSARSVQSAQSTPNNGLAPVKSSSLSSIFSLGKKRKARDDEVDDSDSETERTPSKTQDKRKKRSLFSLGKPASEDDGDDEESSDADDSSGVDEGHTPKRARRETAEEEAERLAFEERERELDAEVDPDYRRFRPRGYKFNAPPIDRPVRIYADGVFDLFHLGHMRQLEQAKKALPNATLICGIPSDEETHARKGLTVLTDTQRCDTLMHCKWVDEVIPNAPWCVTVDFLKKHKIDYVAHDDLPYASGDNDDIYKPVKELGMFLTTQRTEGISTSDIITKIIRDYDKYLMRNFARGASRKDLNVSWLKKNELDLKRQVAEFRESFKTNFESTTRDLYSEFMGYLSSALHLNNPHNAHLRDDGDGARSPATEFAARYSGSFLDNVKDWVSRRMDSSIPPSPDRDSDSL